MNYDDETLMAYADGELDAAQRAQIAAALEQDADLARRVERHRALRSQVAGAFARVLDQPIPVRLTAAAAGEGTKVVQFPRPAPPANASRWRVREWTAMAASLLVGMLIAWRVFAPADQEILATEDGAVVARGALAAALDDQLASTQRREGPVLIGLTFKTRAGGYCRSFTLRATRTAGLACRAGGAWQIPATAPAEISGGDTQPAATALPPELLLAVEARIGGDPLDAAAEEEARRLGW